MDRREEALLMRDKEFLEEMGKKLDKDNNPEGKMDIIIDEEALDAYVMVVKQLRDKIRTELEIDDEELISEYIRIFFSINCGDGE